MKNLSAKIAENAAAKEEKPAQKDGARFLGHPAHPKFNPSLTQLLPIRTPAEIGARGFSGWKIQPSTHSRQPLLAPHPQGMHLMQNSIECDLTARFPMPPLLWGGPAVGKGKAM
jgi:hypothetical protein